jgi:lysophospholipase L1-like esterase
VLGDSFTWGHGVEDEQVYTRLLEKLLDGVEVLNFGLSASSTDQQLLILRRHVLPYRPDLVVVMVTRNDFFDTGRRSIGSYGKPTFVLESDGRLRLSNVPVPEISWLRRAHYRLRRHSGVLNLLERALRPGQHAQEASGPRAPPPDPYRLIRALLRAMRTEAAAAESRFAIAITAMGSQTYPDEIPEADLERHRVLEELADSEAIPLLDLIPGFRRAARDVAGRRLVLHYPLDLHWTVAGHRLAAEELDRLLRERGLVPHGGEPRLGGSQHGRSLTPAASSSVNSLALPTSYVGRGRRACRFPGPACGEYDESCSWRA